MKKTFWVAVVLLFAALVNCQNTGEADGKSMKTMLTAIAADLKIGNDARYDALLAENKHLNALAAPPFFRDLLADLAPFRFDLSFGIEARPDALVFVWFVGEFGAAGTPDEVLGRVSSSMKTAGFTAQAPETADNGFSQHRFQSASGRYQYEIILAGPERFVGAKETRSGGSLTLLVTVPAKNPLLTVNDALAAFPALRAPVLDPAFETLFERLPLARTGFGGTWEQYYDWTYAFRFPNKANADFFAAAVEANVTRDGFLLERDERGGRTFMKPKTHEPVIFIERESELIVCVRFQPHT